MPERYEKAPPLLDRVGLIGSHDGAEALQTLLRIRSTDQRGIDPPSIKKRAPRIVAGGAQLLEWEGTALVWDAHEDRCKPD